MANFSNSSNSYRYILDKSSRKFFCPECEKKRFVKFIDIKTGQYLPDHYGRCDKGDGHYFLNPYLDGYAKMIWEQEQKVTGVTKVTPSKQTFFHTKPKPQPKNEPVYFDFETFRQTLEPKRYEQNIFIQNLLHRVAHPFKVEDITKVIQLYRLGTISNGYRTGAITFPFIDINDNVRTIQVKQFDSTNHTTGTDFLHSMIEKHHTRNNQPKPNWLEAYIKQDKRVSCLFGEHLLSKYPYNPIALVEAPKTAIYGSLYFGFPESNKDLIWLAVYNKSSFSFEKTKVLEGRTVLVFPDLSKDGSTFDEWNSKAKNYQNKLPKTRFRTSDLLEQLATKKDREQGNDLADVLIQHDWRLYRKQAIQPQSEPKTIEAINETEKVELLPTTTKPTIAPTTKKIDSNFIIEARKDYTENQILQAIADTQPTKEPKTILAEMIKYKRLHRCKATNSIYYVPF